MTTQPTPLAGTPKKSVLEKLLMHLDNALASAQQFAQTGTSDVDNKLTEVMTKAETLYNMIKGFKSNPVEQPKT